MINLELYRIFKIVADEENLTKASEILHISQPAVTKHIKNLEKEMMESARKLDFERATELRDMIFELKSE